MSHTMQNNEEQFKRFMEALKKGDTGKMEASFSPNFINKEVDETMRRRPLHIAVAYQQLDAVCWLLIRGADINSRDERGLLPIHFNEVAEDTGILEKLVEYGADVNSKGENGNRAIHYAAMCGHVNVMKWIWSKGGDIDCINDAGRTPLHVAAAHGQINSVRWLLDVGADAGAENTWHNKPFDLAALAGQTATVDLLQRARPDIQTRVAPYAMAIAAGRIDEVKLFLDGANGRSIIDVNEPMSECGETAMHLAANSGQVALMALLAERGANIEAEDCTKWRPLHQACHIGKSESVRWLVETAGCILDGKNSDGRTPVELARRYGKQDCVRIIETEQAKEFKVLHLPTVTVICGKYALADMADCVATIQTKMLTVLRPLVICHLPDATCNMLPYFLAIPINSSYFHWREYVVIDSDSTNKDVFALIQTLRKWTVKLNPNGTRTSDMSSVTLKELSFIDVRFTRSTSLTKWKEFVPVAVEIHQQGVETVQKTVTMLVRMSTDFDKIKTALIDFHKFLYGRDVLINSKKRPFDDGVVMEGLSKLVLMNRQLVMFYDSDRRKLLDSSKVCQTDIMTKGKIFVVNSQLQNIQFVPPADRTFAETVPTFIKRSTIVVLCATDDGPCVAMLRSECCIAADVIGNLPAIDADAGRIMLLSENKSIDSESSTDTIVDIVRYAMIHRFANVLKSKSFGKGAFGRVFECTVPGKEDTFAIKIINKDKNKSMMAEMITSAHIGNHERIMRYHRYYEDERDFYFLMDVMKESLFDHIQNNNPLKEERIVEIARQILQGLSHLHDHKILHRDIKSHNVLFDKYGNVKLTDFGMSKCTNEKTSMVGQKGGITTVGTYNWCAPEVVTTGSVCYGSKADIWSFGATMVEMVTGQIPFHGITWTMIILRLSENKRIDYKYPSNRLSQQLKAFIESCLNEVSDRRPDCVALLGNEIFKHS